jgi:RNA polymerase sigma-70 factor (ECF subfamily)
MSHDAPDISLLPPAVQVAARLQGRAVPDDGCKCPQAAIVRQLCCGDRTATERFVREHTGWMLALAKRYLKDQALAEDCVQEAFLQAFRSIREFEGRSALKSWLFRIVVNTALMRLRSRRGSGEQCLDDVLVESERGGCRQQAWTEVATPQEVLQRKEVRELVVAKLMELPDGYGIVLLLRDIEGYSTEDAARVLGMTEGAIKVRLHRARAAFKVLVAPVLSLYV